MGLSSFQTAVYFGIKEIVEYHLELEQDFFKGYQGLSPHELKEKIDSNEIVNHRPKNSASKGKDEFERESPFDDAEPWDGDEEFEALLHTMTNASNAS